MFRTWSALGFGGGGDPLPADAMASFLGQELHAEGIFALNAGYVYSSLILTAAVAYICERKFHVAALWAIAGSALSALGFMHAFEFGEAGYTEVLEPAWEWCAGYLVFAGILFVAPWVTRDQEDQVI